MKTYISHLFFVILLISSCKKSDSGTQMNSIDPDEPDSVNHTHNNPLPVRPDVYFEYQMHNKVFSSKSVLGGMQLHTGTFYHLHISTLSTIGTTQYFFAINSTRYVDTGIYEITPLDTSVDMAYRPIGKAGSDTAWYCQHGKVNIELDSGSYMRASFEGIMYAHVDSILVDSTKLTNGKFFVYIPRKTK